MKEQPLALVTGANTGMGKATALALARAGFRVVMLCRNQEKGKQALEEVRTESGNPGIELMLCDLGSLKSIREFCREFREKYTRLNVLVNNAGVILPGYHTTSDGFELQFGVNHLGHFLLTLELLDLLKAGAPARIVIVASGAHRIGWIHFEDVNLKENYTVWRAYAQSKLANILFAFRLAEKLKGTGVTVNCLHPGAVASSIAINRESGFGKTITRLLKVFFQTPEQGAETAVYLALSPEVEGITGEYYHRKRPASPSPRSRDRDLAERLWTLSEQMTGIR